MTNVAVATTSQLAADAAEQVANAGGNAVDCALAAALVTMNTEPGVCALAGSAFVTIWAPGSEPVTIDGNVAVPGAGLASTERGRGVTDVTMAYGSGVQTLVGPGSVSIPGALAAIERAWQTWGRASWKDLFAPVIAAARDGFPLSAACHYYLGYSGDSVFGRSDDGFFALHDQDRKLLPAGSAVHIPHLADSLEGIANEGADLFYRGELARRMVEHVREGDGALTLRDLSEFEAIERSPLIVDMNGWQVASNPPPAVGGAVLSAMLHAGRTLEGPAWNRNNLNELIRLQRAALGYRKQRLDLADDVGVQAAELIDLAGKGLLVSRWASASTVHTSAVDSDGVACAVTASSGYGSGEMPAGTGLWLNNCLGELELNRRGLDAGPVGSRLPSNMTPIAARCGDAVLAAGSPGADRITTALHQFLVNYLQFDMPLRDAIAQPRLHIDTSGAAERLMSEPIAALPEVEIETRISDDLSMYFGGVGAARFENGKGFEVAADPRREGGIYCSDH